MTTIAQVGQPAPDFKAKAVHKNQFVDVQLSAMQGQYVYLLFYPLDFTFVCPTELTAFSDRYTEFERLNTVIWGISVDSEYAHLAWTQTHRKQGGVGNLNYALVSDMSKDISRTYNVLDPKEGVALRGLFLIDPDGIIQHATINNLNFGRSVDEALRVLQAAQFVRENSDQVCPANWQPGQATMSPDPIKSLEYFSTLTEHVTRTHVSKMIDQIEIAAADLMEQAREHRRRSQQIDPKSFSN